MADLVAETIMRIVAAQAMIPVEAVWLEATPEELGLDSLGMVEMVFAIEEAFDIAVPFNANGAATPEFDTSTIGAVVTAVRGLLAEKTA